MQAHAQSAPVLASWAVPPTRRGERERPAKAEALRIRLHAILHQNLTGLTGIVSRSRKTWQLGLRGLRPVTLRDLAELATSPTREARDAINELCGVLLDAVRPTDGTLLGKSVADFSREASEIAAYYSEALDDGTLSLDECEQLQRELADVSRELARLGAVLEGHRRRLAS